jgi:hypothetical protein
VRRPRQRDAGAAVRPPNRWRIQLLDLWEMLDGSSKPGLDFKDTGKLRIFGIGPGVMWGPGEHDKLFADVYFQLLVENGVKSNVVNLRWIHGFP